MERDAEVRALAKQMKRLDVADNGLCFGRLDALSGEQLLHRPDRHLRQGERLRTAAARLARPGSARVLRRHRRQPGEHAPAPPVPHARAPPRRFHRRGARPSRRCAARRRRPDADAALLAAVNAPRGEGMRDIVATIQAEQDEIIRLDHPGVLVIEGGPGTGKTVVALHRVAYLLYTQRSGSRTPRRARGRAQPGVPEPHRPRPAVAGRDRRGVHDHRRPRARPARHRRGHARRPPGSRARGRSSTCSRRRSPIGSGCRSSR